MDLLSLIELRDLAWALAAIVFALAALITLVRTRAAAWRGLVLGAKSLRQSEDVGGELGTAPSAAPLALVIGASLGGAAWVALGDALALGGAGVLPWLWLGGILAVPLAHAETWLARTESRRRERRDLSKAGSLVRRLWRTGQMGRLFGALVFVTTFLAALVWGGLTQGTLVLELGVAALGPAAAPALVAVALIGGGALGVALLTRPKLVAPIGWLAFALVGLAAVLALAGGLTADAGGVLRALGESFGAAFDGSARHADFTGASSAEVRAAALAFGIPLLAAVLGVQGSLMSHAGGPTRRVSAAAPLAPLAATLALTLAALGSLASAQHTATDVRVPVLETRAMRMSAESASQREESNRRYEGYVRVVDGEPRNPLLSFAHPRGMISEPHFQQLDAAGEWASADFAFHATLDGGLDRLMTRESRETPLQHGTWDQWHQIAIRGEAVPSGPDLVAATFGPMAPIAAVLLALLTSLTVAGFGVALGRGLPPERSELARGLAVLPALAGLPALTASPTLLAFALPLGLAVLALHAIVVSLAIVANAGELEA